MPFDASRRAAEVLLEQGQAAQAVGAFQAVLATHPEDGMARFGLVLALYRTNAFVLAWNEASRSAELFTSELTAELRHRAAVELLHQGQASEDETRAPLLAKSVALMEANGPLGFLDSSRASDLVVAYFEAGQYDRAVALFEATNSASKEGAAAWSRLVAAKSYARLGRLTQARKLLEELHAAQPLDVAVAYALVFVYSDLHRFADAQALLKALCAELLRRQDPEAAYAMQLQARLHLWAGERTKAKAAASEALVAFPQSAALKRLLADIARDAGQYGAARTQLEVLSRMDSDDVEARIALAMLHPDDDSHESERDLQQLNDELGGSAPVQRALEDLRKERAARVRVRTASNADRDSTTQELAVRATSPAWGSSATRVFVEAQTSRDQLEEGRVSRQTRTAGVEASLGKLGHVEVAAVQQPVSGTGLSVGWNASPADGWRLRAGYLGLDTDIAARAWRAGVTASSYGFGADYAGESVSAGADARVQSLSDGNVRRSASFVLSGILPAWGNLRPDWALRAGIETASNPDVSYFSPRRSWWTDGQIGLALPKWQLLATDLYASLRPALSLGTFSQSGYGTLLTGSAELGADIDLTARTSLGLSAGVVRRPYDGRYVTQQRAAVVLNTRL